MLTMKNLVHSSTISQSASNSHSRASGLSGKGRNDYDILLSDLLRDGVSPLSPTFVQSANIEHLSFKRQPGPTAARRLAHHNNKKTFVQRKPLTWRERASQPVVTLSPLAGREYPRNSPRPLKFQDHEIIDSLEPPVSHGPIFTEDPTSRSLIDTQFPPFLSTTAGEGSNLPTEDGDSDSSSSEHCAGTSVYIPPVTSIRGAVAPSNGYVAGGDHGRRERGRVTSLRNTEHQQVPLSTSPQSRAWLLLETLSDYCVNKIPRNMYLLILLRLPDLYFSRLSRILHEIKRDLPEIEKFAHLTWLQRYYNRDPLLVESSINPAQSEAFNNVKLNWESFIDLLTKEWKINGIMSVLLLTAILTTLQLEGVSGDPVSRNAALASLVCGLMSLLYGSIYSVRFGTMRKGYKAIQWAEEFEAQHKDSRIFWNAWVFLSMPIVWLAWSIVLFITSIMTYVWRASSGGDQILRTTVSRTTSLAPRVVITGLLVVGTLYFGLIIYTFRCYGDLLDEKWKSRVATWVKENVPRDAYTRRNQPMNPPAMPISVAVASSLFNQMPIPSPWATPSTSFKDRSLIPTSTSTFRPQATHAVPISPSENGFYTLSNPLPPVPAAVRRDSGQSIVGSPDSTVSTLRARTPADFHFPANDSLRSDPLSSFPSPPVPGLITNSLVTSHLSNLKHGSHSRFRLLPGDPSNRYEGEKIYDFDNTYKAIIPFVINELNPFNLQPVQLEHGASASAPLSTVRIMSLTTTKCNTSVLPEGLSVRGFGNRDWRKFITEMELAWRNRHPVKQVYPQLNPEHLPLSSYPRRQDFMACLLHWWNIYYFSARATTALLCEEFLSSSHKKSNFAIYLVDDDFKNPSMKLKDRFIPFVGGFQMMNIYRPFDGMTHRPSSNEFLVLGSQTVVDFPPPKFRRLIIPFSSIRVVAFKSGTSSAKPNPPFPTNLGDRDINEATWNQFIAAMHNNWNSAVHSRGKHNDRRVPQYASFCQEVVEAWNAAYFLPRKMAAIFYKEHDSSYSIYLVDSSESISGPPDYGNHSSRNELGHSPSFNTHQPSTRQELPNSLQG